MSAASIVDNREYQRAFMKCLSHEQGDFVPYDKQDGVKRGFFFKTTNPQDCLHDDVIRRSRCFFCSSTGMLCLFSDESAFNGTVVLFVDNESCIIPVGTNPFNIIHQLNDGLLELDGVANVDEFVRCCEHHFGVIDWSENPELIATYLSHFDS
jgi:hypothetical protein